MVNGAGETVRLIPHIILLVMAAGLSSCQLARSKSSVSLAPDSLEITGKATVADGAALGSPEIFLGTGTQPIGLGENDGSFSLKVDSRALAEWQAQNCTSIRIQSPSGRA